MGLEHLERFALGSSLLPTLLPAVWCLVVQTGEQPGSWRFGEAVTLHVTVPSDLPSGLQAGGCVLLPAKLLVP